MMYAIWCSKYKCGELADVWPIVFKTRKQARNYASKHSNYRYQMGSPFKVSEEWCNYHKPDYFRVVPRQEVKLVRWEDYKK